MCFDSSATTSSLFQSIIHNGKGQMEEMCRKFFPCGLTEEQENMGMF